MTTEQPQTIKCGRCGATVGSFKQDHGRWKCTQCIWNDQQWLLSELRIARTRLLALNEGTTEMDEAIAATESAVGYKRDKLGKFTK